MPRILRTILGTILEKKLEKDGKNAGFLATTCQIWSFAHIRQKLETP